MSKTVTVAVLQSFQHNSIRARRGDTIALPEATSADLVRAGLVRIAAAPQREGKEAPAPDNKNAPARKTKAQAEASEAA